MSQFTVSLSGPPKACHSQTMLMRPLWYRRVAQISDLYHKNSGVFLKYSCGNRVKIAAIIQPTVALEAILHHTNTFSIKALTASSWRVLELSSGLWVCVCRSWEPSWLGTWQVAEVCGSGIFAHTDLQYPLTSKWTTKVGNKDIFWALLNLSSFTTKKFIYYKLQKPTILGSSESCQLLSFSHLRLEGRQQMGVLQWSNLGFVEMW